MKSLTLSKSFVNTFPRQFNSKLSTFLCGNSAFEVENKNSEEKSVEVDSSSKLSFSFVNKVDLVRQEGVSFGIHQRRFSTSSGGKLETTQVPDFSAYKKSSSTTNENGRALHYVMMGTTGFIGAMAAKNLVVDFLTQLTPSSDVLALAKAEVDISNIPEGKNVTIKWRGKPVFIRHRTASEIEEANSVDLSGLRDPESDAERVQRPEWLVVLGICTHLGCVPIGEAGDYDGWYCPCHGSHYDISGRIRKGPAPLNLEIPPYSFTEDSAKIIIG